MILTLGGSVHRALCSSFQPTNNLEPTACTQLGVKKAFHDSCICVGEDQGVGGGVHVGGGNIHLLVLDARDRVDLGEEEDEVTHVDVVAQCVNDEEEVRPVLDWFCY